MPIDAATVWQGDPDSAGRRPELVRPATGPLTTVAG